MSRAQRTRQRLQDEAIRLFVAKGYHNVTVEEIAEAAGVSHMTFFRHFPTKVSVIVYDPYDPIIGEMVSATDPGLPTMTRVCRGLLDAWTGIDQVDDDMIRARFRILTDNDDIVAQAWANNRRTEEVIVGALISTGVDRLVAKVSAGAVMGAITASLIDWGQADDSGSLGDRLQETLELIAPVSAGELL